MEEAQTVFGPFVLDRARQTLLRDGEPLPLGHRGYLILETLLDANGETVSKTILLERAWPGLVVEEANLTVQIGAIRRAMGAEGETLLITVPRSGYRLLRLPAPATALTSNGAATAAATIAVMPFANLSGDPDQNYFADGMVEELITALSRFKSFAVVSRTSTFAYKSKAVDIREAARELGVRYLLEGSVRRAGDRLRVTARLVDSETGADLWAEKFDGSASEVFAFQDSITENVVGLVEPTIRKAEIERARRKPPNSLKAYDLFLRAIPAMYGMLPQGFGAAIALLERAIEIDPTFAPALAFAAWTYEKRLNLANDHALQAPDIERCLELVERALAVGADDPMVLGICGWLTFQIGGEDAKGLSALRRSLAANPNNQVVLNLAGYANAQSGDLAEARSCFRRVFRTNPGAPDAFQSLTGLAMVEVVDNNLEAAVTLCEQSLATFNEWPYTYLTLAAAYAFLGRAEEARANVDRLLELIPGLTLSALSGGTTNRARPTGRWMRIVEGLRLAGLPSG
ncbi:MAG: winged helix-turn-helix domain-containing protein [Devosia sp.]